MGEFLYKKDNFETSGSWFSIDEKADAEANRPKTPLSFEEMEWKSMVTEAEYYRYRKERGKTLTPEQEEKLKYVTELLKQRRREALRISRAERDRIIEKHNLSKQQQSLEEKNTQSTSSVNSNEEIVTTKIETSVDIAADNLKTDIEANLASTPFKNLLTKVEKINKSTQDNLKETPQKNSLDPVNSSTESTNVNPKETPQKEILDPVNSSTRSTNVKTKETPTPTTAELNKIGEEFYKEENYDRAYEIFSEVTKKEPDNLLTQFYLGVSGLENGRYNEAIAVTNKLIESGYRLNQTYYFQGIAYEQLGQKDLAKNAYKKASRTNNAIGEAHKAFMRLEEERLLGRVAPTPNEVDSETKSEEKKDNITNQKDLNNENNINKPLRSNNSSTYKKPKLASVDEFNAHLRSKAAQQESIESTTNNFLKRDTNDTNIKPKKASVDEFKAHLRSKTARQKSIESTTNNFLKRETKDTNINSKKASADEFNAHLRSKAAQQKSIESTTNNFLKRETKDTNINSKKASADEFNAHLRSKAVRQESRESASNNFLKRDTKNTNIKPEKASADEFNAHLRSKAAQQELKESTNEKLIASLPETPIQTENNSQQIEASKQIFINAIAPFVGGIDNANNILARIISGEEIVWEVIANSAANSLATAALLAVKPLFFELVKIYQSENLLRNSDRSSTDTSSNQINSDRSSLDTSSNQINSDLRDRDTFSPQKNATEIPPKIASDAQRLYAALKEQPDPVIFEILDRNRETLRQIAAVYNGKYGDLVADLKNTFKLSSTTNIFRDTSWRILVGMLTRAGIEVPGETVEYHRSQQKNFSAFKIDSTSSTSVTPQEKVTYSVTVPERLAAADSGAGYQFNWYVISSNPDDKNSIYIKGPNAPKWDSFQFETVGEYKVIVQIQYYPNGRINSPEDKIDYVEYLQKVENPQLIQDPKAPKNLEAEINLYREKLLTQIPSITARYKQGIDALEAGIESISDLESTANKSEKIQFLKAQFQTETQIFAAWNAVTEKIISLFPAVVANDPNQEPIQQLQQLAANFLNSLTSSTNTAAIDPVRGKTRLILLAEELSTSGTDLAGIYQNYYQIAREIDNRAIDLRSLYDSEYKNEGRNNDIEKQPAERNLLNTYFELEKLEEKTKGQPSTRLTAYFYPDPSTNDTGKAIDRIPLTMYYWSDETNWYLSQIKPEQTLTVSVAKSEKSAEFPPSELFEKLNSNNRFPVGVIRYLDLAGEQSQVEVTGNWGLSDWLGAVGLATLVLGVGLLTKNPGATSKVAVWGYRALYASTAAATLGAAANLAETTFDGSATPVSISLDLLGIISGTAAISSQGSIVINQALSASKGAAVARLARFSGGTFIALKAAETGSDSATLVLFAGDSLQQLRAIQTGPGTAEQRNKATNLLILQLIANGTLMALGIRGNIGDLNTVNLGVKNGAVIVSPTAIDPDLPKTPDLVSRSQTQTNQNRQVGEIGRPKTEIDRQVESTSTKDPEISEIESVRKAGRTNTDVDSKLIPTPPESIEALGDLQNSVSISVDPELPSKTVRVYYKPEVYLKVGPDATPEDIKLHLSTVRTFRRYSGLVGKIRALIKRINDWITQNGEPPVGSRAWEAKLELEKLPQIIEARQALLASGELNPAATAKLVAEIAQLQRQLDRHQLTLDALDKRPGKGFVAAELDPDSIDFSEVSKGKLVILSEWLKQLPQDKPDISALAKQISELETSRELLFIEENKFKKANNEFFNGQEVPEAQLEEQLKVLEDFENKIKLDKKQLTNNINQLENQLKDKLEAQNFIISAEGLKSENSNLGSGGFRDFKKWHQDIIDTEKLIDFSPELKDKYRDKIKEQKLVWLSVPKHAQSEREGLTDIINKERFSLTKIRNEIAPQLISQKEQRLEAIKKELQIINVKISPLNHQKRNLQQGGRDTANINIQLNSLLSQRRQLNAEQVRLNDEIKEIKTLQQRALYSTEVETFANNASVNDVWQRLTKNSNDDAKKSSSRKWADVLIREKIVSSDREIIAYIKTQKYQDRAVSKVRRNFKNYYRPQLLDLIYSQPTSELRYIKMREIAENLDVQGQGYFSEDWYQKEFTPRIDSKTKKEIPNTTQATLGVETAKSKYDIDLDTLDNRRFDELYGDETDATIREHKHVSKQLQGEQLKQFQDNIKIVRHNRNIDAKLVKGEKLDEIPQNTPVIIEGKDGKKFKPKNIVYTFATPEG
nr:hypothetical protein [Prochloraceae cyanobacterium]